MENQKQEVWKEVVNYQGHYMLSVNGDVKSLKRHREIILKPILNRDGYGTVHLSLNGEKIKRTIHQLMAEAFLGHVPCGFELVVEHKNHIRTDNRLENLEIITARENGNQKHIESTSRFTGVSLRKSSKKWKSQIFVNGKMKSLGVFDTEEEASEYYENALKNHLLGLPIEVKYQEHSSKYKGVSWHKKVKKWRAFTRINEKQITIGYFITELEAHNAYQQYINNLKV